MRALTMDKTMQNAEPLRIQNITYLLALALELEASERYAEVAEQMQAPNNPAMAELFQKL